MKTLAQSLAVATILAVFGTSSAHAQSSISLGDYYNDYELYVAEYETNWYTIVTWNDGTVSEYRSYSQQSAQDWSVWLWLHVSTVQDIDIVSRVELGDWEYIDTYGTYSLAASQAGMWETAGFETDIRSIRVNTIYSTPYRPITFR